MQPAARLQAVIEILDDIETGITQAGVPADVAVANYTRPRRYIGSKDRRAIIEMVYAVVRKRGRHAWRLGRVGLTLTGRNLVISHAGLMEDEWLEYFGTVSPHAPDALSSAETSALNTMPSGVDDAPLFATHEVPDPTISGLQERFGAEFDVAVKALNHQAPLDVRANPVKLKKDLYLNLRKIDEGFEKQKYSPIGYRSFQKVNLSANSLVRGGFLEVQDEAAQLACYLTDVSPDMSVVDLCAGAGGKTLLMSALMQNKGQLFAFDTSAARLKKVKPRIDRAGCRNVQSNVLPIDEEGRHRLLSDFAGKAARVVIDAPCSGTGTWRRNPDQRWRLTEEVIKTYSEVQLGLLTEGSSLVTFGGRLVYMTCSLLPEENEAVVKGFLESTAEGWSLLDYRDIWRRVLPSEPPETASSNPLCMQFVPHMHQTDGFFIAILEKPAN